MVGVEAGDEAFGIVLENLGGFFFIDIHAGPDDIFVEVVLSAFEGGASFHAGEEVVYIAHLKNDDMFYLKVFFQQLCLLYRAGYAIEKEELPFGKVAVGGYEAGDIVAADLDCGLIGDEVSFACVGVVDLACG